MTEPTSGAPPALARDALHTLCLSDPVWAERYEGWADLGRGGSATVVRVRSRDAEAEIAVKVFFGLTAEGRPRFGREVQNAQRLTSPYIVRTLSPFVRGSLAWIEMELVEGPDLRQELERRAGAREALPLASAVEIARAVGEALRTAHGAGVVHRDVKPANVLLPKAGRPAAKLGDFGIARIVGSTRVTATGLLAGTPQFAAPEVVSGREAGPASDVYGLALCLYLMLSGNHFPFEVPEGASPAQWLRAHVDLEPRSVTAFCPELPADLVQLVMLGLSKDPGRRPSIEGVLAGLDPHRAASLAQPAPLGGVAGGVSRPFWPAVVSGLIGLTLGAGTSHWIASDARPRTETPISLASLPPTSSVSIEPTSRTSPPVPSPSSAVPSPASAAPSPSSPPPAPALVGVSLQDELVTLLNSSAVTLTGLTITLIDGNGARHVARIGEPLGPGEEESLALDDFDPRLAGGARPERVEVTSVDATGKRGVTRVTLSASRRP